MRMRELSARSLMGESACSKLTSTLRPVSSLPLRVVGDELEFSHGVLTMDGARKGSYLLTVTASKLAMHNCTSCHRHRFG